MKRGLQPPPRGMTLEEIAAQEHCSVATIERALNSAVAKLKRRDAFWLLVWCIRACTYSLLKAGSVECQGEWIEKNIGELSYADRWRLQNHGRAYSSCRASGDNHGLSGASNDSLDQQDHLWGDVVL